MVSNRQAYEAARKIRNKFRQQGRSTREAKRDAERWVEGTWGLKIDLDKMTVCRMCDEVVLLQKRSNKMSTCSNKCRQKLYRMRKRYIKLTRELDEIRNVLGYLM